MRDSAASVASASSSAARRSTAGDRAGAPQHARIQTALLREEFDAEPDAALTALADQPHREPREPPAPKPAPAPSHRTVAAPLAPADPAASAAPRRRGTLLLAGAAALVLVLASVITYWTRRPAAQQDAARSVGVLPFVNMSPDPANTYLSDGVSEQIILALSRVRGLRVAARTSSFALRNRELSVRAIADTLDVQAVLEGSVLVDGERLRVIAQLIDARTGRVHRCCIGPPP